MRLGEGDKLKATSVLGDWLNSRGLAHEGCLSPPKEKIIAQADLKSACMELGICNPKSSTLRESCGSEIRPSPPDGLQIRLNKGQTEAGKAWWGQAPP